MQWSDIRKAYPDQWLIIEALEAHSAENRRLLDRIAVAETCRDGADAMQCYRRLHQQYPGCEFYFVHTSRDELDIHETRRVGLWRGNLDGVEMKRRIQEQIYAETRNMKTDEFLAYIHKQVQESQFAAFFAGPGEMTPASSRGAFQPVAAPMQVGEADAEHNVTGD